MLYFNDVLPIRPNMFFNICFWWGWNVSHLFTLQGTTVYNMSRQTGKPEKHLYSKVPAGKGYVIVPKRVRGEQTSKVHFWTKNTIRVVEHESLRMNVPQESRCVRLERSWHRSNPIPFGWDWILRSKYGLSLLLTIHSNQTNLREGKFRSPVESLG